MGLVISKRHRPDSPFASQCHSIVLQPRLPVSPLLSASTHTRSTLQGFRSRIAPQTALSPRLSPRFLAIAHCTIAPWGHWPRYRRRSSATPSSSRKAARQQTELFCAAPSLPLALSRGGRTLLAEPNEDGSPCREPIFLSNLLDPGEPIFVCCSIWEEGNSSKLCGIERRKGGGKGEYDRFTGI